MSVRAISSSPNVGQYSACISTINVIKNGTFEEIRNLLKSGTANFQEMENGQTLLNLFCKRSLRSFSSADRDIILEIVEILSSKLDVNAKDESEDTPLNKIIAKTEIRYSFITDIAKILLNNGAIIDERQCHCPIHFAARNANWQVLEKLLDYVDPNDCEFIDRMEDNAQTILHALISNDQLDLMKKFLEISSSSINIPDIHGNSPLHEAVNFKKIEAITILLNYDYLNVNVKDNECKTPFVIAVLNQDVDIMIMLTDRGASKEVDPRVFEHITDEEAQILNSITLTKKAD